MAQLFGVFTVALVHTLIPSHWLCFVVVGRAHGWSTRKVMGVAATAGILHVVSTVGLGIAGGEILHFIEHQEKTLERVSGLILIALGGLYLVTHVFHLGHHHEKHDHPVTERTAYVTLLFSLVLSPCTAAIFLLTATAGGAAMIALVGIVLLITTVGGMLLLVGLTSLGIEKLRFQFIDRYEKLVVGLVLVALGTLVLVFQDGHTHAH